MTTYGLKKGTLAPHAKPFLLTTDNDWISARFIGLGSNHAAKEWKTEKGALNAAKRFGGVVFTIQDGTMNY